MCVFVCVCLGGLPWVYPLAISTQGLPLTGQNTRVKSNSYTRLTTTLFLVILLVALSDLLSPMTIHSMLQRHFPRKYILFFALHSNELMNFRVESCWSALRSHPFLAHHQPHTRTHSCLFSCTGFFYGSGIVLVELLLLDSPLTSHIVVVVVHVVAPFFSGGCTGRRRSRRRLVITSKGDLDREKRPLISICILY